MTAVPVGDGHLLLFSRPDYLATVVADPSRIWRYDHLAGRRLIGSWVAVRSGNSLESGYRAPFAGPDVAGDPSPAAILEFLGAAMDRARSDGVDDIAVRARPRSYGPAEDVVQYGLLQLGFRIECCDLSFAVPLAGLADLDSYLAALQSRDRNRLRQAMAFDSDFRVAGPADDKEWQLAFELLSENRRSKGRHTSITLDYLLDLRDRLTGDLHMTVLRVDGSPCAAALLYRVRPDVMLMVNWGDANHQLPHTPMPLLAACVTVFSGRQGARLLDLGRATEDGPPNLGLMQFKRNVLGQPEMRPNYRWTR